MAEQDRKAIAAEELDQLEALVAGATTPGRWHWSGNTDTGEPYLATWVSGAGRCQVLAIGYEERSTTGQAADKVRADAAEFDLGDPDELVEQWAWDQFGEPARDPRLQLMTDLMSVNARDMAVYEVAPEAMSREDHRVYRADVVDILHPDAQLMVAAVNALPRLLAEIRTLRTQVEETATWLQPKACELTHDEPFDFGQCETHDRTFALGATCDHADLSEVAWLEVRESEQRGRAVRAEMRLAAATEYSGPWRDRQGDVWTLGEDGLLHTPETSPFSRALVERKWGPLVPTPPDAEVEAAHLAFLAVDGAASLRDSLRAALEVTRAMSRD